MADRPVVPREAGQCPRRKGAEQDSLFDESNTAAPEADNTVSTKLAELAARARKEARLTNVVQFVDEELLRLAFRSLRKQAAPGVDGQSYEDYAANLDQNLQDCTARLKSGRYQAPVIRRVYIPKANGKLPADRHHHDRRSGGAKGGSVGTQRSFRAGLSGLLTRIPPEAQPAHGAASAARRNAATLGEVRRGG